MVNTPIKINFQGIRPLQTIYKIIYGYGPDSVNGNIWEPSFITILNFIVERFYQTITDILW